MISKMKKHTKKQNNTSSSCSVIGVMVLVSVEWRGVEREEGRKWQESSMTVTNTTMLLPYVRRCVRAPLTSNKLIHGRR